MTKSNPQRGEVTLEVPGKGTYVLCLTLGAMAQMEEELQLDSLGEIGQVLQKMKVNHVITILLALINGGGKEVDRAELMGWNVPLKQIATKIKDCFMAGGFNDPEEDESPTATGK